MLGQRRRRWSNSKQHWIYVWCLLGRVGCDAKLTQTTGWCPKTRSAPRTQQARVTDPLMAQCWSSFSDAGTTLTHQWLNASCLLGTQLLVP